MNTSSSSVPSAGPVLEVVALVNAFEPRSEREATSRERFLRELGRLDRPFDRDAGPVHVTASAIVTGRRGTVLHKHKRLKRWLQPGGHIDPGEEPWMAALRETAEETGLRAAHPGAVPSFFHLDAHPASDHFHLDLRYLVECVDIDPAPGPGESREVKWFGIDEALELADDALIDGLLRLRDWLSG